MKLEHNVLDKMAFVYSVPRPLKGCTGQLIPAISSRSLTDTIPQNPESTARCRLEGVAPTRTSRSAQRERDASLKEVEQKEWEWRGWKIRYVEAGMDRGDGQVIVCVHGFGGNCMHFRRNIGELGRRFRVFSIDLLGFGLSDKPPPGCLDEAGELVKYDFDYWTAELREFVRQIAAPNGGPVALVANSIGCMVTMQLALESPELVTSLVIISPSLRMLNVRKRSWLQNLTAPALVKLLSYRPIGSYFLNSLARPAQLKRVLRSAYGVHDAVDDELVNLLSKPAATPGALDVFLAFINFDGGPIPEDFLPQLRTPTMMIHGEEDRFEPFELAKELRHYATVEKFVSLPGVGHCAMDEVPETVNELIVQFLGEQAERQSPSESRNGIPNSA